ncbi:uncharacterized protein BCR38DRAFT_36757 [Pseudomassariella vexata]|uniref:Uncharacterized protein n=1 Tax=Pseudomassariella vexata TaxID=1141098 RepID=A0A1Y2DQJ3_9PEZI|nr:uncharacterized protein BCR38DRAFT_36757 [Pseudomassariella vexata]ORY61561.1 hypothetical protein BCR38DRAFT_36757 [Pseudomassariella vexata]
MKLSMTKMLPSRVMQTFSSVQIWAAQWQLTVTNFVDNPTRSSIIPQFLIDSQHPWIVTNQRQLEGLPDVEAFLYSSLESTKGTAEHANYGIDMPPDLFEYVEIDNNRWGVDRPGWPNALERLREMKRSPLAMARVKTFKVEIWVHDSQYADWYLRMLEPLQPPKELLSLFVDVLESMESLETLKWNIPVEHGHWIEETLNERNLSMPSVKRLDLGPFSHYLVGMCPNLETLEPGGRFVRNGYWPHLGDPVPMMVESAGSAPKLKRFSVESGVGGWSPAFVSGIYILFYMAFMPFPAAEQTQML